MWASGLGAGAANFWKPGLWDQGAGWGADGEKAWEGREARETPPTEIRLIIFFAAKDGEALYSQQKEDLELTVAQILSSLLQIET